MTSDYRPATSYAAEVRERVKAEQKRDGSPLAGLKISVRTGGSNVHSTVDLMVETAAEELWVEDPDSPYGARHWTARGYAISEHLHKAAEPALDWDDGRMHFCSLTVDGCSLPAPRPGWETPCPACAEPRADHTPGSICGCGHTMPGTPHAEALDPTRPLCPAGHGLMDERAAANLTAEAAWCGTWFDCPDPECTRVYLQPSTGLEEVLARQAAQGRHPATRPTPAAPAGQRPALALVR
jgi:hypothetical protein